MFQDPHLVPLKPELFRTLMCPSCGADRIETRGSVFPGIHVLGDYHCTACGMDFLRDLPVGFAVDHPMAIDKRDGRLFNLQGGASWIHEPLVKGYKAPSDAPVPMERIVHRECRRVVILNTLDFLYGHVLLKLFNAQHYLSKHPDLGLVLLIPRMYRWLVPKGTAEVWSVDLGLARARDWSRPIDAFVQAQLQRYDEVYLGKGYAHPDLTGMDMERFTGLRPLALNEFLSRPPHITFVAREDRLWFRSALHKVFHRAFLRLGLGGLARWSIGAQRRLIQRTMERIRWELPECTFSVVGLGDAGGFAPFVDDLRTRAMNEEIEMTWCRAYAKSQIVIGVHGSNMLLPTAFAAGCVEILPRDRLGNIVQDLSVRWADRMQLFLYRFVDEFAGPRVVARQAISMFRHFASYHRDNRENIF